MKHTVVIVDDHTLIADLLSEFISDFDQFKVLYTCKNGKDFQEKLKTSQKPNIVLLDISMPVMDGFETALWLKNTHPEVLVLVLSMQNDEQSLIKMIKNGARGYLLKNSKRKELKVALSQLVTKGSFFPDWTTNKIITWIEEDKINAKPKIEMSEREKEFLKYVPTELTYKQIADKMCCSPRTIENYRDSLFEKLEVKSRVMLAVYAIKNEHAD